MKYYSIPSFLDSWDREATSVPNRPDSSGRYVGTGYGMRSEQFRHVGSRIVIGLYSGITECRQCEKPHSCVML